MESGKAACELRKTNGPPINCRFSDCLENKGGKYLNLSSVLHYLLRKYSDVGMLKWALVVFLYFVLCENLSRQRQCSA